MPDLRSGAIGAVAGLAGLPWRLNPSRGRPLNPSSGLLRRVVVIKPCCMGDALMSTPAVAALRRALPDSHIAYAAAPWAAPAIYNNPRLSRVIESPVGRKTSTSGDYLRLARLLRGGRFGAALVLDRSPLLNLVPYLAGIPVRAGLDSAGRGVALTHPVPCPPGRARHEVQWYLDVVRALGVSAPESDAYLEFYPSESDRTEASRALALAGGDAEEGEAGYVCIHLGGGVNPGMRLLSKRWHPQGWARIADWLAETYECSVILLGGPGKEDREAADALKASLFPATHPYVTDLTGMLGWGALAAVIERCRLFLGHDTGAMHLATAVRTPVVAVFGPSDPARFGPWDPSGRSTVVQGEGRRADLSDAGALRRAAASDGEYHPEVSPEQVWAAVQKTYRAAPERRVVL